MTLLGCTKRRKHAVSEPAAAFVGMGAEVNLAVQLGTSAALAAGAWLLAKEAEAADQVNFKIRHAHVTRSDTRVAH